MIEENNKKNIELYRKYGCMKRTKEYIYTCTKCGCKCSIDGSYSDKGNNLVCRFCYESEEMKMAKLFRISGYLVAIEEDDTKESIGEALKDILYIGETWQQLHIEESEEFELDGEDKENCDLALLTRHFKKDNSNMEFGRPLPERGQKYKHFKLGKIVTVIGISRHTETEEVTVVYDYEGTIWNRPIEMFMSEVDSEKYPDAKQKYRFELLEGGGENKNRID